MFLCSVAEIRAKYLCMASYVNEIKAIQKAVGSTADGIWGPKTLAAVASKLGCAATVKDVQKKVGVR